MLKHARWCCWVVFQPPLRHIQKYGLGLKRKQSHCLIGWKRWVAIHRSNILLLGKHSKGLPRRHQGSTHPHFNTLLNRHEESHAPTILPLCLTRSKKTSRLLHLAACANYKSLRGLCSFFSFFFVSECPTRWGVDDPAASSRHQLEGQGGAGKSLHSNYYSNLPNTCNYRGNHTRQPNTVKYQRTQLEPGPAGRGDLCTKVPLSEIHANNWIQCYCCINTHCSKEAYIV